MSRRTTSLTVCAVSLVALVAIAFAAPMPYVVMSPGVTENVLGTFDGRRVIAIEGRRTYPTSGSLDLTTVSVSSPGYEPRLPEIIEAWWDEDEIVLPRDVVYPPDQSVDDVQQENQSQMLDSQQTAVVAGLSAAGIDAVSIEIQEVSKGAPADGRLRKGDQIMAVDDKSVETTEQTVEAITRLDPGTEVSVEVLRDGTRVTVQMVTEENPDEAGKSRIGVSLSDIFDPPFKVDIELGQEIGGPSAGMMFSLAIYDLLTPGSLTGGRHVAGTGVISPEGVVGPIGGIQQKIAGAYDDGATVFLVPADDCPEAVESSFADEVDLVRVDTLDDAVNALEALESGQDQGLTRCGEE